MSGGTETVETDVEEVSKILFGSLSASAKQKYNQALNLVTKRAAQFQRDDPARVAPSSSQFVVNILLQYTNMESAATEADIKKEDALVGMISGLRWVYELEGHKGPWTLIAHGSGKWSASGNPLVNNRDIDKIKLAHRRNISAMGATTLHAPVLPFHYIVEHAKSFWLYDGVFDRRDSALHALLLIGVNCGLRFDEIQKMKLDELSCTPHGITFVIRERTKNSLACKEYVVEQWPGSHFKGVLLVDPFFAVSSWLEIRGDAEGYVLCDINSEGESQRMRHTDPWPRKDFSTFLRRRLVNLGMAPAIARFFTGHSLKRTCVVLLRTLGVLDIDIMNRIKMEGVRAYLRYTEALSGSQARQAPGFNSIEGTADNSEAVISSRDVFEDPGFHNFVESWINNLLFE